MFSVKSLGFLLTMQKILKQHNSIGVESVTDATKDEKGMYSLNVTAKGGYTHLFLDKDRVCQEFCVNRFNKQHRIAA